MVPLPPHWVWLVPDWQVPDAAAEQQPVGHACDALHVKAQIPPEQPWAPAPQSFTEVQPHCPPPATGSQTWPCVLPEQLLHAPPLLPHCPLVVPATHLPPLQQPPLQGCVALHVPVHRWVVVSHAASAGQSATELHPQNVLAPLVTHCTPAGLDAQLVHAEAPPVIAHAAPVVPCTQAPALQQPPLHVRPPAHDAEQAWVAGSHAWPTGQSVDVEHPPPPSFGGPASPASVAVPSGWPSPAASYRMTVPSPCASAPPSSEASAVWSSSPLTSSPHDVVASAKAPA